MRLTTYRSEISHRRYRFQKGMALRCMLLAGTALALSACAGALGAAGPEVEPGLLKAAKSADAEGSAMLALARNLEADGNLDGAIPIYRHLAAGGDPAARLGLGRVLVKNGDPGGALAALDTASTDTPEASLWRGRALVALGRYDAAVGAFRSAGSGSEAVRGLGVALAASGDVDGALGAFERDSSVKGRSNRALLLALTGRPGEAEDMLTEITRASLGGPRERQNLALVYLAQNRGDDALAMARVDLDVTAARDTLNFYRTVLALPESERMRAMITGTVEPARTREEDGNLVLADRDAARDAAARLTSEPAPVAEAAAPRAAAVVAEAKPEPAEPAPTPARPPLPANAPKLLEPEGWALQIGAYRTIERLIDGWKILRKRNIDILETIEPRRSEIDFGPRAAYPRGFYYRLNAGPLKTFKEADTICSELRARGTKCWIRPPEPAEGRLPGETSDNR